MKNLMIIGMLLAFAGASSANHTVINIQNADKVVIKGSSAKMNCHKCMMMKCIKAVAEHKTLAAALAAKMAKINGKCARLKIVPEKCDNMKKRAEQKLTRCFKKVDHLREMLKVIDKKSEPKVETPAAPEPEAESAK